MMKYIVQDCKMTRLQDCRVSQRLMSLRLKRCYSFSSVLQFCISHFSALRIVCGLALLQLLLCYFLFSQPTKPTTVLKPISQHDSLYALNFSHIVQPDSVRIADSLAVVQDSTQKSSGIDSVVVYSSNDSIVYSFQNKRMKMFGKSDVRYRTMGLTSERIDVNWNTNELEASGIVDTAQITRTDSLRKRYTGMPVMKDGGERYDGFRIAYNFKSQKGKIILGETKSDQGLYYGEHIKKIEKDMLFLAEGKYTTCEYGHPHYFFLAPEMRVTIKDKIVARPIYLYISDVPIFALPFGVFPSQSGRRSGIIAPGYGDAGNRGRFIEHLGYYEAISDYMDMSVGGDWYDKGSWKLYPNFRYAERYDFSGSVNGSYSRFISGEAGDVQEDSKDYYLNWTHSQRFTPTADLNVNFTFASNDVFKTNNNYNNYLQQNIVSNATFNKRWEGTNNSISININRNQDLQTGNISQTLPSLSFSHGQSFPFRSEKKSRRISSDNNLAWYEMIGMGYSSQFLRSERKTKNTVTNEFDFFEREGAIHNFGFNASPKAGYITITPSLQYTEKWYDKSTVVTGIDSLHNAPIKDDAKGFFAVRTFGASLSASTKLYGMLASPIPGVAGFRHTITPNLSYNYQPDFSKKFFGYYGTYKDTNGVEQKYDRFEREIFLGSGRGEQQSISLSVGNLFEMKTSAKDTTEKEKKYQLLNLSGSISYNAVAEEFRLTPLSLSYRTDIGQYLSVNGSSTYSFYKYDEKLGRRVNRFLSSNGGKIADLTSFSISLSTSLSGEKKTRAISEQAQANDSIRLAEQKRNQQSGIRNIHEEELPDFSIPWNLSLSFNFLQSQDNPKVISRSANVNANLGFNLTENWRFTASGNYDLVQKQFAAPSINIFRDLHCWEMNFSWQPIGARPFYRFEIRVKAPQLQDVKVTKQSRYF